MPVPYSYDLRRKVIEAVDAGRKKTEVSKFFNISRNTINLWLNKRKDNQDYQAEVGYQKGYRPKIANLEDFRQFAQKHGGRTQAEMAEIWPGEISSRTIGKALKKLGYTRKKKLTVIEKEMKIKDGNFEKR